jgi:hypothetical protein
MKKCESCGGAVKDPDFDVCEKCMNKGLDDLPLDENDLFFEDYDDEY